MLWIEGVSGFLGWGGVDKGFTYKPARSGYYFVSFQGR
jgi:hypothetical protein